MLCGLKYFGCWIIFYCNFQGIAISFCVTFALSAAQPTTKWSFRNATVCSYSWKLELWCRGWLPFAGSTERQLTDASTLAKRAVKCIIFCSLLKVSLMRLQQTLQKIRAACSVVVLLCIVLLKISWCPSAALGTELSISVSSAQVQSLLPGLLLASLFLCSGRTTSLVRICQPCLPAGRGEGGVPSHVFGHSIH